MATAAVSPGVSIVSGNGEIMDEFLGTLPSDPLTVRVADASGNPVPAAPVTWVLTIPPSAMSGFLGVPSGTTGCTASGTTQLTCTADSTGKSSIAFTGGQVGLGDPYAQYTVKATASTGSATFYETILPLVSGVFPTPEITIVTPAPPPGWTFPVTPIVGQAGQTLANAIQARVTVVAGAGVFIQPIPNAALRVSTSPTDPNAGPPNCQGGVVLTDSTGLGKCNLVLGTTAVADGLLYVHATTDLVTSLGAASDWAGPIHFTVNPPPPPGPPATIQIVAGNNQSGKPGQALPAQLQAQISDANGTLISGVSATWTVTPVGAVTFSPATSVSDANGLVSTTVTLGVTASGAVQVQVTAGSATAKFTETINLTITGMTKVSGDSQTADAGALFANPLVVQVSGTQVANIGVTFAVASGSATLSGTNPAITNAEGQASINVVAGATPGPVQITASAGGKSVTFNLTVVPPPPPVTAASFLNGASLQPGVSIGAVGVIKATGLLSGTTLSNGSCISGGGFGFGLALSTQLHGVEVQFGSSPGVLAPLYALCRNSDGTDQINLQVPFEIPPGPTTVTITTGAGTSSANSFTVTDVPVAEAGPAFFQYLASDGSTLAIIERPDGSVVGPSNPAQGGEMLLAYMTGLGVTSPVAKTNQIGRPGQVPTPKLYLSVNWNLVSGLTAEYAENMIGVYVVSFQLPSNVHGNKIPIAFSTITPDDKEEDSPASEIDIQ